MFQVLDMDAQNVKALFRRGQALLQVRTVLTVDAHATGTDQTHAQCLLTPFSFCCRWA